MAGAGLPRRAVTGRRNDRRGHRRRVAGAADPRAGRSLVADRLRSERAPATAGPPGRKTCATRTASTASCAGSSGTAPPGNAAAWSRIQRAADGDGRLLLGVAGRGAGEAPTPRPRA